MLAALTLIACLKASPLSCQSVTPLIDPSTPFTLPLCAGVAGQEIAREWAAEHPAWGVQKVICTVGKRPDERSA